MRPLLMVGLLCLAALGSMSVGCAVDTTDDSESSEGAVSAEDRGRADKLLAEARDLAAGSREGRSCANVSTMSSIVKDLYAATAIDKTVAFRTTIASDVKIRAAVGQTLDYAKITGAIRVEGGRVLGLANAVKATKISLYTENDGTLELRGNGKATLTEFFPAGFMVHPDRNDDGAEESSQELTYEVREEASGTVIFIKDYSLTLKVRHTAARGGKVESIDVEEGTGHRYGSLPSQCKYGEPG